MLASKVKLHHWGQLNAKNKKTDISVMGNLNHVSLVCQSVPGQVVLRQANKVKLHYWGQLNAKNKKGNWCKPKHYIGVCQIKASSMLEACYFKVCLAS